MTSEVPPLVRYLSSLQDFAVTEAKTQGPQGTVSPVVVEDEKKILVVLGELWDLFRKYAPQLLNVFKL